MGAAGPGLTVMPRCRLLHRVRVHQLTHVSAIGQAGIRMRPNCRAAVPGSVFEILPADPLDLLVTDLRPSGGGHLLRPSSSARCLRYIPSSCPALGIACRYRCCQLPDYVKCRPAHGDSPGVAWMRTVIVAGKLPFPGPRPTRIRASAAASRGRRQRRRRPDAAPPRARPAARKCA